MLPRAPDLSNHTLKFFLDKFLALLWLLLASPLMGLIAVTIKAEGLIDPTTAGPVLAPETRMTRGRPFHMYKFRTSSGQRRTRVGRYLRKWYLDELPQCINILKGEMTFVGPRPDLPEELEDHVQRGLVSKKLLRAGLTGATQANKRPGRGYEEDLRESIILEREYLDSSLRLSPIGLVLNDLKIVARTIAVVWQGEGL